MGDPKSDTELQKIGANTYPVDIARAWDVWGPDGGCLPGPLTFKTTASRLH